MFEKFYLGAFGVLKANVSMELLQTCCGVCHTYTVISHVEYVVLHVADPLQCVSHIRGHVTCRTRCVPCCRPVQCVSHIWSHVTRRVRHVPCCRSVAVCHACCRFLAECHAYGVMSHVEYVVLHVADLLQFATRVADPCHAYEVMSHVEYVT